MKGLPMYSKIQQLKQDGLRKAQVARNLGIDRKTVRKYWDMTLDEYQQIFQQLHNRNRKLDKYKEDILTWLYRHNDYTSAQILDLLWEKYPGEKSEICYSTLRRYVRELRAENNIPKGASPRQYQAIVDPPMGYQAQVDLGYTTLLDAEGKSHDLCVIAMVLSHSRHKYFEWFDRPPVAADFINFHERAFNYFGGMPEEIVYDQDRLIIVNENFGDIIYTLAFENYRQRRKFRTFICRSADPETKGRIEAVVKYVKYNFAKHRIYTTVEELNHQSLAWLERTGNAKVHSITKKVPAEVFLLEKNHLRKVPDARIETILETSPTIISRVVRKNNTVEYEANRYSVPLGTFESGKEVGLRIVNDQSLQIIDLETGELIAEHVIALEKGQLIQNSNHLRNHSQKIERLYLELNQSLGETPLSEQFLNMIRTAKPRYIWDQFTIISKAIQNVSQDDINKALTFLIERQLWSATTLVSVLENLDKLPSDHHNPIQPNVSLPEKYQVVTEVRDLSEYEQFAR